jgi:uncharacterized protein
MRKFKNRIKKLGNFKVVLFGSRARGDYHDGSDFDVIVISEKFKDIKWNKRPFEISLEWKENYPLEVLCYTPSEYSKIKKSSFVIKEAEKEGIEI